MEEQTNTNHHLHHEQESSLQQQQNEPLYAFSTTVPNLARMSRHSSFSHNNNNNNSKHHHHHHHHHNSHQNNSNNHHHHHHHHKRRDTDGHLTTNKFSFICSQIVVFLSYSIVVLTFPLSLLYCLKVIKEYERAVIFRLGRCYDRPKGPGLFFILPCVDNVLKIDLRTMAFDVKPQEILTKDSVTISVDAVVYLRIFNPLLSVNKISNVEYATRLLAAASLRNIVGTRSLQEILQEREAIARQIQEIVDSTTLSCKDVSLPVQLQKAMAKEAEASREAKAKLVIAQGEYKASRSLKDAAEMFNQNPIALQLRYLQTLSNIAAENNSTIIFPIPIENVLLQKTFK